MHESVAGTFRKWRDVRLESAVGGKADLPTECAEVWK
jgi:hypothetical protein